MLEGIEMRESAVYDDGALYQLFGISETTLAKARKGGQLRYVQVGKRVLYFGEWLLDWLYQASECGEKQRSRRPPADDQTPIKVDWPGAGSD